MGTAEFSFFQTTFSLLLGLMFLFSWGTETCLVYKFFLFIGSDLLLSRSGNDVLGTVSLPCLTRSNCPVSLVRTKAGMLGSVRLCACGGYRRVHKSHHEIGSTWEVY